NWTQLTEPDRRAHVLDLDVRRCRGLALARASSFCLFLTLRRRVWYGGADFRALRGAESERLGVGVAQLPLCQPRGGSSDSGGHFGLFRRRPEYVAGSEGGRSPGRSIQPGSSVR